MWPRILQPLVFHNHKFHSLFWSRAITGFRSSSCLTLLTWTLVPVWRQLTVMRVLELTWTDCKLCAHTQRLVHARRCTHMCVGLTQNQSMLTDLFMTFNFLASHLFYITRSFVLISTLLYFKQLSNIDMYALLFFLRSPLCILCPYLSFSTQ